MWDAAAKAKEAASSAASAVRSKVDEKMAKVDDQLDKLAQRQLAARAADAAPAEKPAASLTLQASAVTISKPSSSGRGGAADWTPPRPQGQATAGPSAGEAAAAAKAFESVPKGELVALLVKTNGRCKTMETRCASGSAPSGCA
jgi:hypothetical protein